MLKYIKIYHKNIMNRSFLANTTPIVKNLIIANILVLLAQWVFANSFRIDLSDYFALHYFGSKGFHPHQLVTHMFMHGGLGHIFFNMFALYMFGSVLERVWGPKKFLFYYFATGIGAAVLHEAVNAIEISVLASKMNPETVAMVKSQGLEILHQGKNYSNVLAGKLNLMINTQTVGASGAVFGLLLAFGMLFPSTPLYLMFIPVPIKAKYMVIGYGALELYLGLAGKMVNVAHFAHLGGMLFGFILIKYWNKNSKSFY